MAALTLALAFRLACAPLGTASAQEPVPAFEHVLAKAADSHPDETFEAPAGAPADFLAALKAAGYPAKKITNRRALELFRSRKDAPVVTPVARPRADLTLPKSAAAAPPANPSAQAAGFDGSKAFAGGPDSVAAPGQPDPSDPKKGSGGWQGLRFFGLELGGGRDPLQQDNDAYLKKGIPQVLDWDIRGRVDIEGLGARAMYRHPLRLRSFNVGFLKFFDLPAALGLGSARDAVYGWVGAAPEKPLGGFELSTSGAINQYLGGATTYDQKEATWKDRWTNDKLFKSEAGISPLGDNPGKLWNFTLLFSGSYEDKAVREGSYDAEKKGFGWTAGVAFQEALNQFRIPVLQPHPEAKPWFQLDRFRTRLDAGHSEVMGTAFTLATEISVLVFRHLDLTGGVRVTFYPEPDWRDPQAKNWDPSAIVGLGYHN